MTVTREVAADFAQFASNSVDSAHKELSAFVAAVSELFGAEQAGKSAADWIEEIESMDWPEGWCDGEGMPNWRRATLRASARLPRVA